MHTFLPSDTTIQDQAIDCIADLISCHDSDTRYDEPSCRARVPSLYLPLLGIVMENLSMLHGAPPDDPGGALNVAVANAIGTSSLTSRWMANNDEVKSDFSSPVEIESCVSYSTFISIFSSLFFLYFGVAIDLFHKWRLLHGNQGSVA